MPCWLIIKSRLIFSRSLCIIVVINKPWWKCEQLISFELELESTADTIFLEPSLAPTPDFTESAGNGAATLTMVVIYDLANEVETVLGNKSFAVENNVPGIERNRVRS